MQQPLHELPPQLHAPLEHAWPPLHALHAAPPVPHDVVDCPEYASQTPPAVQHPIGHEVASQTHCPVVPHSWPEGHAPHVAPWVPHEVLDCPAYCSQAPAAVQHPLGHEVALQPHVPAVRSQTPVEHAAQEAPAVPHEEVDSDAHAWHAPAEVQHPFGHDVASHTQLPAELHSWPVGHALHVVPPAPQEVVDSPENGSHVSPAVQQPAQAVPPHVHAPPVHVPPLEHEPHAAPPMPHSDDDCPDGAMHCPPALQHPPGHDAALHTHCPAVLHVWPVSHAPHVAPPVPHAAADCTLKGSHWPAALQQPWGQLPGAQGEASPVGPSFTDPSWAASPGDVASPPPSASTVPSALPPSPVLASASSCGVPIPASWVHAKPDHARTSVNASARAARRASGETRRIRRPPSPRSRFHRSRRRRALRSPSSTTGRPTAP